MMVFVGHAVTMSLRVVYARRLSVVRLSPLLHALAVLVN